MHSTRLSSLVCPGVLVLFVATAGLGCGTSRSSTGGDERAAEAAIRAVMQAQEDAWNEGDIERFMDGYARFDSLRFASGGNVRYGWRETLEGYRRSYPDRAAMGTLSFELRDVHVLSPRWALVFGAWALQRTEDRPSGLFTLLFENRPEGWRIVSDHTSSGS